MVDIDGRQYVDGFSVNWSEVGAALAGSVILGWVFGVLEVIVAAGEEFAGLIDGARESLVLLIGSAFENPADVSTAAWTTAAEWVDGLGVFGYLASVLIVMLTLYAFSEGVEFVGS